MTDSLLPQMVDCADSYVTVDDQLFNDYVLILSKW